MKLYQIISAHIYTCIYKTFRVIDTHTERERDRERERERERRECGVQ
jgi:hypothetical protein